MLVGFQYGANVGGGLTEDGYDKVDNPLNELFLHDDDLADNFDYNRRYELTGVNYRAASATDYRSFGGACANTLTDQP